VGTGLDGATQRDTIRPWPVTFFLIFEGTTTQLSIDGLAILKPEWFWQNPKPREGRLAVLIRRITQRLFPTVFFMILINPLNDFD